MMAVMAWVGAWTGAQAPGARAARRVAVPVAVAVAAVVPVVGVLAWWRLRRAGQALLVACALGVAGCGGGGVGSVLTAPTIATEPGAQTVTASGVGVSFAVTASGDGLSYQWQVSQDAGVSWVDILGAIDAIWRIAAPDASMNGLRYRVVVRSGGLSTTSAAATLSVPLPALTAPPVDVAVTAGGDAVFSATATGVALRYQWQRRDDASAAWADVAGATEATYVIRAVLAALGGSQYRVLVSSGGVLAPGNAVATLTVASATAAQAPSIRLQPASATTASGSAVTFSIVVDGSGLRYQWQFSIDAGASWTDLLAATAASYTVDAPGTGMTGWLYRVVVTDGLSTVTSAPARLAVAGSALAGLPYDIAIDADGQLLVVALPNVSTTVNQWAGYVQRIDPATGAVFTLAGGPTEGYVNAVGAAARFRGMENLVSDGQGQVYVADLLNLVIRKLAADGTVSTFAGSGLSGSSDGPAAVASFVGPRALAFDATGQLLVADQFGFKIRKIAPDGSVSTLAGSGLSGTVDGTGAAARFKGPGALGVGPDGVVYVGDTDGIRKVSPAGVVSTWTTAVKQAGGLVFDAAGNLYATAWGQSQIYKITPAGVVSVLAGGAAGLADGTGTAARFANPFELTIDAAGNLYVADTGNRAVRKITPAGVVTTLVR